MVVVAMLVHTGRSMMVSSTSHWASLCILVVWIRRKSYILNQNVIWGDQDSDSLPLWVSRKLEGQINKIGKVCHY